MLGTNDAKDHIDGGPSNWACGTGSNVTLACQFAVDYQAMIDLVRTLGTTPGVSPKIFVAIPPPLMAHGSIGANQTVIDSVYPVLVPAIAANAKLTTTPIDIFGAMGGVPNWQSVFPSSCNLTSRWPPCAWYCDKQSCDQCHPNDSGYTQLAKSMKAGLGL